MITIAIAGKIYNSVNLQVIIEDIHKRINQVYINFSNAYIKSALEAISLAQRGNNIEAELSNALNNMRISINVLKDLLEEKRAYLIFFERDALTEDKKVDVCLRISNLYKINAILSKLLNYRYSDINLNKENSIEWFDKGIEMEASLKIKNGYYVEEYVEEVDATYSFMEKGYVDKHYDYSESEKLSIRKDARQKTLNYKYEVEKDLNSL